MPKAPEKGAELRRASFRSFAAADLLQRCGGEERTEALRELQRFETLKDFARRRGPAAGQLLWRGENDWNAAALHGQTKACSSDGRQADALAELRLGLDALVNGIMTYED